MYRGLFADVLVLDFQSLGIERVDTSDKVNDVVWNTQDPEEYFAAIRSDVGCK